jgi:hypothetical protein
MGLNLSNEQIAAELDLTVNDAKPHLHVRAGASVTTQLREGIVLKKSRLL